MNLKSKDHNTKKGLTPQIRAQKGSKVFYQYHFTDDFFVICFQSKNVHHTVLYPKNLNIFSYVTQLGTNSQKFKSHLSQKGELF